MQWTSCLGVSAPIKHGSHTLKLIFTKLLSNENNDVLFEF